ncbi:hypothetical protein L1887_14793 [Cichorium endivia]|nr:hypothetical protein L1887_14793 [Cichorium endivia]
MRCWRVSDKKGLELVTPIGTSLVRYVSALRECLESVVTERPVCTMFRVVSVGFVLFDVSFSIDLIPIAKWELHVTVGKDWVEMSNANVPCRDIHFRVRTPAGRDFF